MGLLRSFATASVLGALVSLAFAGCSGHLTSSNNVGGASDGIIGGDAVADTDPIGLMTAMLVDTDKGALCTASILNNEWLLTAGHCVADADAQNLIVVFSGTMQDFIAGKTNRKDVRRVEAAIVNPKYAETMKSLTDMVAQAKASGQPLPAHALDSVKGWGDLALVHISGTIPRNKKAVQLLTAANPIVVGETVTLAGYGQTTTDKDSSYGSLRDVQVMVNDPAWGGSEVLIDNTVKGACHGDSGGPAYATVGGQLYLFGITSRGVGDDVTIQCVHQTAYTNATAYTDWINSTISGN